VFKSFQAEVLDLYGRTVLDFELTGNQSEYQLNVADLNPGIYLLKLSDGLM